MKKVALITGCSKGIGYNLCINLAKEGYDIIGTYNTGNIDLLQNELEGFFYKLDLRNEEEINNFINEIKNKFNHIDLLINNAALSLDNEFEYKTKSEFMEVLEVNLVAPFLLIQKLESLMEGGVIINIASTDGINTYTKLNIDYSASKAGLINLTKSLSLILNNIRVYVICPNWVNTESIQEMNPDYLEEEMKRVGQSKLIEKEDISKKVIELIESDSISGSIIVMEG